MKRNAHIMWEDWQNMSARIGFAVSSGRKTCFGETKREMAKSSLKIKRKEPECT